MSDPTTQEPPPPAAPVPKLAQFLADVAMFGDQLAAVDPASFATVTDLATWIKAQLVDNVVELQAALANAVATDVVSYVNDLGTVVHQLQEEQDELLSPESADVLVAALDAAEAVCRIAARAIGKLDQMTGARLQQAITNCRARAVDARSLIDDLVDVEVDPEPAAVDPEPAAVAVDPEPGDGAGGGG